MVEILPFMPSDLGLVRLQPAQRAEVTALAARPDYGDFLWRAGPAFTAWSGRAAVACAGLQERQPHHAHGWAFLSEEAGPAMLAITRAVAAAIEASAYSRVDMVVQSGFCQAHRWARLLGFEREGTMRRAGPGGLDFDLYARITS